MPGAKAGDKLCDRLAFRITHNLKTDSEKVFAIHKWIITHIDYDIKKEMRGDYTKVPLEKIIKTHKAICIGYCDLFQALCNAVGVTSATVPGYDKNIYGNLDDHFYLDEHAWNAVNINGEWKLVDVCWDAGTIVYTRRTFLGFFVYLFTGGKHDRVKFNPHFVRAPNYSYYLKSGSFFKIDHIPLSPIWQLTPTTSIEEFANDSAYYYKRYGKVNDSITINDGMEDKRREYISKDDTGKMIADGFAGFNFNYRNHYEIGISYMLLAKKAMPILEKKPKDTLAKIRQCDSVIALLNNAMNLSKGTANLLLQQKNELSLNNHKKNEIFSKQEKELITSSRKIVRNLIHSKYEAKVNKNKAKRVGASIRKRLETKKKDKTFSLRKSPKEAQPEDSVEYSTELKTISDSINFYNAYLLKHYKAIDRMFSTMENATFTFDSNQKRVIDIDAVVTGRRIDYYDDLDFEIRLPKDLLIRFKFKNDSLLFTKGNFQFYYLFDDVKKSEKMLNQQFHNYYLKCALLKKLKASCVHPDSVTKKYNASISQMETSYSQFKSEEGKWVSNFTFIRARCRKLTRSTKEELLYYKYEENIENNFYLHVRGRYISHHISGLLRLNSRQFHRIPSQIIRLTRYQNKLGKK